MGGHEVSKGVKVDQYGLKGVRRVQGGQREPRGVDVGQGSPEGSGEVSGLRCGRGGLERVLGGWRGRRGSQGWSSGDLVRLG